MPVPGTGVDDALRRRLTLDVPALVDRPYLTGSLCCAPAAADLVEGELRSWRLWVSEVHVDGEHGQVEIVVADDAPLDDMLEALDDLGYPAQHIAEVSPGAITTAVGGRRNVAT